MPSAAVEQMTRKKKHKTEAALRRSSRLVVFLSALLLVSVLSGCTLIQPHRSAPDASAPPFIPVTPALPTPVLIVTPTATNTVSPAECVDGLAYLADLTIPDGSQVQPGSSLDKRWEVQNSGSCNWNEKYRLQLIAGSELGVSAEQALPPTRAGNNVVIRIIFQAPTEPGNYRSAWQAYNPGGEPFGDPIFIDFAVIRSETPAPTPSFSP